MTNTSNRYHDRNVWAAMPKPADYAPLASGVSDGWASRRARGRTASAGYTAPARAVWEPSRLGTPILALDVDGPCSPFAMARKAASRAGFRDTAWRGRISHPRGSTWFPYSTLLLSRQLGDMLAEFSRAHDVELVWASLWEHNANTVIAPAMGLPRLPWVSFNGHPTKGLWKYPAMIEYAAGRPLAWLDDSFDEPRKVDQRERSGWAAQRRGLPTLLHRVSPAVGITRADLDVAADWLRTARLAW